MAEEKWTFGEDEELRGDYAVAGITIDPHSPGEKDAHCNAVECYGHPLEVAQARRDRILAAINGTAVQDAFDLGFKAAGGSMMSPAGARNVVELAMDRATIEEVSDLVEAGMVGEKSTDFPLATQFLENVSIYRSRK